MSKPKEEIRLIATEIIFTYFSIIYKVKVEKNTKKLIKGISVSVNNIKDKGLILKSTIVDDDNMEVIFTTSYVTPHFYQDILKKISPNVIEHEDKLNDIYRVGEVVAVILI